MSAELVKRLREFAGSRFIADDVRRAADLIEQQAARIAELEARAGEAVAWLYEADGKRSVTLMDPEGSEAIAARAGFKITPLGPITNSSTGDAAGKDSVDAGENDAD